jgi:protoheme IX farnesyltransferase
MEAWLLYTVLFLWQFPHFMAIAWMYREDYDRADYSILPKGRARVPSMVLQTVLPLLVLVPVSLVKFQLRHADIFYWAALLLALGFLYFGLEFVLQRSRGTARQLLVASVGYLALLFVLRIVLG